MADSSEKQSGDENHHNGRHGRSSLNGEEIGKKSGGQQSPVGFWHQELGATRRQVFKKWSLMTIMLSTFIVAVLSLYWAALFRVEQNISALVVWVVDFDGMVAPYTDTTPLVGPMLVEAAEALIAPTGAVGWGSLPPSHFNNDPMAVRQAIYDEKAWAAIIVNPNATALLQAAVANGNASYDPMGAAQVVYVEARDDTTLNTYVAPQLTQYQADVTAKFGQMWAGQVLSRAATNASMLANLQRAPQAISPAIGFSTYNLRPFLPPVTTPAVSIGLIYLIIISFFSFSFYLPIHMLFMQPRGHPPLKFYQLIIWRWVATISAYFFLSLFYSLISLAFQIPFSTGAQSQVEVANPATAYGKGTFVVYWMVNYVGMISLGLACENVAMIIGMPWTAAWLIFWVITNVATSFYSITLAPHFYYWGYAWPLHNIVNASRTLLFDTHSEIGLNLGVLFAWCAIGTVIFPFCCYFMRWKTMRAKRKDTQQ